MTISQSRGETRLSLKNDLTNSYLLLPIVPVLSEFEIVLDGSSELALKLACWLVCCLTVRPALRLAQNGLGHLVDGTLPFDSIPEGALDLDLADAQLQLSVCSRPIFVSGAEVEVEGSHLPFGQSWSRVFQSLEDCFLATFRH